MHRTPDARPRVSSLERMRAALAAAGLGDVADHDRSPRAPHTAAAAAAALGTDVEKIVKSLVFMAGDRADPGAGLGPQSRRRAQAGASWSGQPITRANADQVRQATGYAIGGVPPIRPHVSLLETFCDQDLLEYEEVWAAAGRPDTVFPIHPRELVRITNGRVADLVEPP